MNNVVKLPVTSVRVANSPSQAVCDKAAFSVHGYFLLSANLLWWRHAVGQAGIDLMDGSPNLLDFTSRMTF